MDEDIFGLGFEVGSRFVLEVGLSGNIKFNNIREDLFSHLIDHRKIQISLPSIMSQFLKSHNLDRRPNFKLDVSSSNDIAVDLRDSRNTMMHAPISYVFIIKSYD